jgi:uncharacterized protein (DUF362 family)
MVSDSLDLIGGLEGHIIPGNSVLIKPNAGSKMRWDKGAVTNPYVIEAIAMKVREAGADDLIIGEASQVGTDTKSVFEINEYPEIAKKTGARLLDLNESKHVEIKINGSILSSVKVFKSALECDVIISVPVIKTHVLAGMTLSIKNMKGVIPAEEKRRFHLIGLDKAIADLQLAIKPKLTVADLQLAIKPKLTVVDGIRVMGGIGAPIHLNEPVELDLIFSGFNPIATDITVCRAMEINPNSIKHLVYSAENLQRDINKTNIKIEGEPIEKVKFELEKPSFELEEFNQKNLEIIERGACSGCIGALYSALKICNINGELKKLPRSLFAIGPLAKLPSWKREKIIIGNCLQKYGDERNYVPGCPPLIIQIRDEVRELIGLPRLGGSKERSNKAHTTLAAP